ncbi:hypothetical protein BY996DRAFT_6529015 [Phakopsora pachyrhizi]|nr:hypothetical protein BY996DRAFT_6529015 [Phakopsora pachyrhizi]
MPDMLLGVTIVGAGGTNSPQSETLGKSIQSIILNKYAKFCCNSQVKYQGMLIHPQGLLRIASIKLEGEVATFCRWWAE